MTSEQKAALAMDLLGELMRGICAHPEQLTVELREGEAYEIAIDAHPVDSRRLVGREGAHIRELTSLARLLFHGTGRLVTILPITFGDQPEEPRRKMVPDPDWPREAVLDLTERLVGAVFPRARVQVEIVRHNDWSSRVEIYLVSGAPEGQVVPRLASALHTLFVPYGSNHGHILFVNVNLGGSNVDGGTGGAGRAAGPDGAAGVPRRKPDARRAGAQGGPDGLRGMGGLRV